jgi:hypothetical protein
MVGGDDGDQGQVYITNEGDAPVVLELRGRLVLRIEPGQTKPLTTDVGTYAKMTFRKEA